MYCYFGQPFQHSATPAHTIGADIMPLVHLLVNLSTGTPQEHTIGALIGALICALIGAPPTHTGSIAVDIIRLVH